MYFEVAMEYKMRVRLIRSSCDHIWKGQIQVLGGKKREIQQAQEFLAKMKKYFQKDQVIKNIGFKCHFVLPLYFYLANLCLFP